MSVLPVVPARYAPPSVRPAVRAFFVRTVRRMAAGAVDNSVLRTVGAPARVRTAVGHTVTRRPRARWHAVTGADGRTRLEAEWRPEA